MTDNHEGDSAGRSEDEAREPDQPQRLDDAADAERWKDRTEGEAPPADSGEPDRIWDPASGQWVTEDELATAPPPAAAKTPERMEAPPTRAAQDVTPPTQPHPPEPQPTAQGPRPAKPMTARPGRLIGPLIAGVVGGAITVLVLFLLGVLGSDEPSRVTRAGGGGPDAVALSDEVRPAVVNITLDAAAADGAAERRAGSGVVLQADGVIATTALLVGDAQTVRVTFSSGLATDAAVLVSDPITDVAIVQVNQDGLPTVPDGTVEDLRLGEPVVAVSSPTETYATVVEGVVASVGRPVRTENDVFLLDMIQVDAPLPTGGSGGVLMNGAGDTIGLVSSVSEGSGAAGYAVPIDIVRSVATQAVEVGDVEHPWIGAIATPVDESTGLPVEGRGLVVAIVFNGSPAEEAGIEPTDIIVGIDGEPIEGTLSLTTTIAQMRPGDELTLQLLRDGDLADVTVRIGERPRAIGG